MLELIQWGGDFILALQQAPWLVTMMKLYTGLGTEEFFLLLMPALYWSVNASLGARMAVVLITSNALNAVLKLVLALPRPYWVDPRVMALDTETTYGLPSGHAQNATAVWGYLAAQAPPRLRRGAWALAALLIGLITFSRLYLGVHYPLDALGGLLAGALVLWAVLRWERPAAAWLSAQSLARQLAVAALASLVHLALVALLLAVHAPRPDPPEWLANASAAAPAEEGEPAIDPRGLDSPVTASGLLFGMGAALAFRQRWGQFDAGGPWLHRVARYVIGVLGILLVWGGLDVVFPTEPLALGMVLRFVRYALTAFWALFGAPWVFLRVGLARAPGGASAEAVGAGA